MCRANIEICIEFSHAFDSGDADKIKSLLASTFIWHHLAPRPGRNTDLNWLLGGAVWAKKSYRYFGHRIQQIHGMGDFVVMHTNGVGQRTDQPIDSPEDVTPAIKIIRLADGQIQELWSLPDMVGFLLNHKAVELSPQAQKLLGL